MALKLKYPKQIVLLRGNHEDRNVNRHLGFGKECAERLGEDINDNGSVFQKINNMFDHLPLAAIIEDKTVTHKVLCVHAGVGPSINKVEDLERI
jgi:protein phosphatase